MFSSFFILLYWRDDSFVREVRIFVCVCTSVCLGGSRVFCQVQPRAGEHKCADGDGRLGWGLGWWVEADLRSGGSLR